jgi:hypothetical protein
MRLTRYLLILIMALAAVVPLGSQTAVLQPADIVYEGFRNVRTNGEASTYGKALTHRYVNGELRFLTVSHDGLLMEFKVAGTALGGTITATTATWQLPSGMVDEYTGIWWDAAKNRLWVTRSLSYGDAATWYPTRISVMTLGSGSVSNVKTFSLNGVPSKQVFGGALALPAWAQAELGCAGKPYVVGFGGYTSLMAQTSPASVGPAMFCIPDPDTIGNGATVPSSGFKTLLNAVGNRGYRATAYTNQVDYPGDPWLGKNPDGSYYFTWNDSYFNTGMWIEGATKRGYVAIASLETGRVRYADGGVQADGTAFELHIWNPTRLDDGLLTRPDSMTVLNLPRGNTRRWGDYGVGRITGATYDPVSGRMYLIGFPFATDNYTGRLYSFVVNAGGPVTPPPPSPVDATYGPHELVSWGAWGPCEGGSQSRTETWVQPELTPAQNGGTSLTLAQRTETRTGTQACTVTPPPPPPVSTLLATMTVRTCTLVLRADSTPDGTTGWGVQFRRNGVNHGTRDASAPFTRSATVNAGSYAVSAIWTKTGQPTVTVDGGTVICE